MGHCASSRLEQAGLNAGVFLSLQTVPVQMAASIAWRMSSKTLTWQSKSYWCIAIQHTMAPTKPHRLLMLSV